MKWLLKWPDVSHPAPVADLNPPIAARPVLVTIAIALLWTLLAMRALGSITQLGTISDWSDPYSVAYATYLATMVLAPAFLLVNIALARNWARVALLAIYALNLLFRVFLFVNDGQFTTPVAAWLFVPATLDAIALALLFLPGSNSWFSSRPNTFVR